MNYFIEAWHNLYAAKLRTLLAMLGILVGTASVVAMVSSGELAAQQALAQFKSLGTDMLALSIYNPENSSSENNAIELTALLDLPHQLTAINNIAPYVLLYSNATFGAISKETNVIGVTHALQNVLKLKLSQGRFIADIDNYTTYCVVGSQLYTRLATQFSQVIGQQIKLDKLYFTIVGVIEPVLENNFFNQDLNNAIIIPIKAATLLNHAVQINNIVLRLNSHADIAQLETNITQQLTAPANKQQKLFFRSAQELINSMTAQHKIFTWLLGLIGSVALLVGGIGVMNIMLVSVLERRREIGIRLALGARRRDIQAMFLSEAVTLSTCGGLLGILLGILIAFIIARFAGWEFSIFILPCLAGFAVSMLTGIFFGFYPAKQAAQLDPITTLRID